ncbi:MAG: DUF1549 domain-containing protein [Myxococcota bacterium]|nr:DUF1549 domain-containing protein [Myxococcota bacterium]
MLCLMLLACGSPEENITVYQNPTAQSTPLDDAALLRRISLDLRGTLPSLEELQSVESGGLEEQIERYLQDPLHEERLVHIFNQWFKTKVDHYNLSYRDYHLPEELEYPLIRASGEEPLRLLASIAASDRPWTDSLAVNYTVSNELLQTIWPLSFLESEGVWRKAAYTDGRPPGGVLMTNGLWWRYYTTPNNYSRSRAMVLSELFLCENYLHRPIKFSAPALLDRESLNEFIRTDPACIGCHSTLDPIAASLFGFWWFDLYDTAELSRYHPEREHLGAYYLEQEPAWFGTPISSPADLGPLVAADPRFTKCTAKRITEILWHRQIEVEDFEHLQIIHDAFEASEWNFASLLKKIMQTHRYQAGAPLETLSDEEARKQSTHRLLSVDQLQSVLSQIGGLDWTYEGFDQFQNDIIGYRILLGGFDGVLTQAPAKNPNISQQIAIKRLAQATAKIIIDQHWNEQPVPILQGYNLQELRSDSEDFSAFLMRLHLQLYAQEPTPERIELDRLYWEEIASQSDEKQAWISLISLSIRDPLFWTY